MINLSDRVLRYLASCPPAVSGAGGHGQTFFVACKLLNGFDLSESRAMEFLKVYNEKCQPQWSEKELEHKIKSAAAASHAKPRGHMLNGAVWSKADFEAARPKVKPRVSDAPKYRHDPKSLPQPIADGARRLLEIAFGEGEGVNICKATFNKDGKSIPENGGTVYSREEWLTRLDSAGYAKTFPDSDAGWFIRLNPMKVGGNKDADVTAYRHTLIEFDKCEVEEQWSIIQQSNIPCTAVLSSGGKSVHAWVRVDAKDGLEYAERVKILFDHFKSYGVDPNNKNPSRFSRLPGVARGAKRQELLATYVGATTFEQWLIDAAAAGIGQQIEIRDLINFKEDEDPNCVIGRRWLCRGGSCLWVGQSGVGKSSLSMQAAVAWALGRPFFGVTPKRALKSLIIQAENDLGDTAEMFRGVLLGMQVEAGDVELLKTNIVIIRDQSHIGVDFAAAAQKLIEKHRPDLAWVDPLLSFFGDDISNQKACSTFLRNWLNPVAEATGVIWMLLHHTGKPSKDGKAFKGWTSTDFSYMGTGSSELTNWCRAAVVLQRVDVDNFKLMFTKRGKRAGATDLTGDFTTDVWLQHAEDIICWEQIDEPESEEKERGRPARIINFPDLVDACRGRHWTKKQILTRAMELFGIKSRKTASKYWEEIVKRFTHDATTDTYSV